MSKNRRNSKPSGCLLYASVHYQYRKKLYMQIDTKNKGEYLNIHKTLMADVLNRVKENFLSIKPEIELLSTLDNGHNAWFLRRRFYLYCCLSTKNFKMRTCKKFLEDFSDQHQEKMKEYESTRRRKGLFIRHLTSFQKNEVRRIFQKFMKHHNDYMSDSMNKGFKEVKTAIGKVKIVVDKSLTRVSLLTTFGDKIDKIEENQVDLSVKGGKIARIMACEKYKMIIFLGAILVFFDLKIQRSINQAQSTSAAESYLQWPINFARNMD